MIAMLEKVKAKPKADADPPLVETSSDRCLRLAACLGQTAKHSLDEHERTVCIASEQRLRLAIAMVNQMFVDADGLGLKVSVASVPELDAFVDDTMEQHRSRLSEAPGLHKSGKQLWADLE